MKRQVKTEGFTLLEIMVAVFLVGITASFVVLNFDQNDGKKALHEARQFAALTNHVLDEAILLGKPIGIEVNDGKGTYQFKLYSAGWRTPEKDDFLRERKLPDRISMTFQLLESTRPVSVNSQQKSSYTPSRVHEILNDSILDLDEEEGSGEDLYSNQQMIVAEPTGLLPPFTLEVFTEGTSYTVSLDDFGKAVVENDPNAK